MKECMNETLSENKKKLMDNFRVCRCHPWKDFSSSIFYTLNRKSFSAILSSSLPLKAKFQPPTTTYRFWRWNSNFSRCRSDKFSSFKTLSWRIKWLSFFGVDPLTNHDMFEKCFWSESTTAHGTQIQSNIWRWNFDENFVNLLILVMWLMLVLLGLIKPWMIIVGIEICWKNFWYLNGSEIFKFLLLLAAFKNSIIIIFFEADWHN